MTREEAIKKAQGAINGPRKVVITYKPDKEGKVRLPYYTFENNVLEHEKLWFGFLEIDEVKFVDDGTEVVEELDKKQKEKLFNAALKAEKPVSIDVLKNHMGIKKEVSPEEKLVKDLRSKGKTATQIAKFLDMEIELVKKLIA